MLKGGKQLSQTFSFSFVFSADSCLRQDAASTGDLALSRSHARWLRVAMEKPRNGADNSSMREWRLWRGLQGGSKFLGPVLSNHQALLMRENGKEDRVRERVRKTEKEGRKMGGGN